MQPAPQLLIAALSVWLVVAPTRAEDEAQTPTEFPAAIEPADWVVKPREGDYRRAALHVDPVEAAVARGAWTPPTDEQLETGPWRRDAADRSGDLAGGYAYAEFDSPAEGVMLLEAPGAAAVCLNGEWIPGDPYGVGWFRPPAPIAKGTNRLLVHLAAPSAKPRLVRPDAPVTLLAERATLPDLVVGETPKNLRGSIPIVNASPDALQDATLSVAWKGGEAIRSRLRLIDSLLATPVGFLLPPPEEITEPGAARRLVVEVIGAAGEGREKETVLARAELPVRVVDAEAARTRTFRSKIDGSVQAYRVAPAKSAEPDRGLLVALHDAGQTADECLREYGRREDADLLAPGGRGRWGFDWEGASRVDALEAIDDHLARQVKRERAIDPQRISVVGRGMGGHGALVLGTTAPDRFAAIGVTDGWVSFYSRGRASIPGPNAGAMEKLLARSAASRDPLRTIENLRGMGVSVMLTGARRAAPSESRTLRERLAGFHNDFWYREATDGEQAADLRQAQVDWLLSRRAAEIGGDEIAFATPDIGLLATRGWVTLIGSKRPGEVASVRLQRDATTGEVVGNTKNVQWLRLDLSDWPNRGEREIRLRLDGAGPQEEKLRARNGGVIALAKDKRGRWRRAPDVSGLSRRPSAAFKQPLRAGGFGAAFTERPILAYGSQGDASEKSWAAAKARYDAHLFWYRGAGRLCVVSDEKLMTALRSRADGDPLWDSQRSIVLYGSRTTNAAWGLMQQEAFFRRARTLSVEAGRVELGDRPESGDGLAVLAVRPRPTSARAYLAVIGGTDLTGMRMTTRLRYFWAGVSYPDLLMFGADSLRPAPGATPADDVRAAGWFGPDWGVDEVVWRDAAI